MAARAGNFTIYALTEQDGTVRYVGRSQDVQQRFRELMRSHRSTRPDTWIQALLEQQQFPKLLILEENVTGEDKAIEQEGYWIDFYDKKDGLLSWFRGHEESEVTA